jgi:hypothetical protein
MPNHVTTRITLDGPVKVIETMLQAIKTEVPATHREGFVGDLIYRKGIHYGWHKKDTNEFSARDENGNIKVISTNGVPEGWEPDIKPAYTINVDFSRIIPMPPTISTDPISLEQQQSTPGRNWYDWNCNNWGTKWNSYDHKKDEAGRIIFDTAWSFPTPIFVALSRMYPEISFKCETMDEGSCFWGTVHFRNGKETGGGIFTPPRDYNYNADPEYCRLMIELKGHDPREEEDE